MFVDRTCPSNCTRSALVMLTYVGPCPVLGPCASVISNVTLLGVSGGPGVSGVCGLDGSSGVTGLAGLCPSMSIDSSSCLIESRLSCLSWFVSVRSSFPG